MGPVGWKHFFLIYKLQIKTWFSQNGSVWGIGELNMDYKHDTNSRSVQVAHTCRLIAPGAIEMQAPLTVGLFL